MQHRFRNHHHHPFTAMKWASIFVWMIVGSTIVVLPTLISQKSTTTTTVSAFTTTSYRLRHNTALLYGNGGASAVTTTASNTGATTAAGTGCRRVVSVVSPTTTKTAKHKKSLPLYSTNTATPPPPRHWWQPPQSKHPSYETPSRENRKRTMMMEEHHAMRVNKPKTTYRKHENEEEEDDDETDAIVYFPKTATAVASAVLATTLLSSSFAHGTVTAMRRRRRRGGTFRQPRQEQQQQSHSQQRNRYLSALTLASTNTAEHSPVIPSERRIGARESASPVIPTSIKATRKRTSSSSIFMAIHLFLQHQLWRRLVVKQWSMIWNHLAGALASSWRHQKNLIRNYMILLEKRPFVTKSITEATIQGLGDILSQSILLFASTTTAVATAAAMGGGGAAVTTPSSSLLFTSLPLAGWIPSMAILPLEYLHQFGASILEYFQYHHDWHRTLVFMLTGFIFEAPFLHVWYNVLDRFGKRLQQPAPKSSPQKGSATPRRRRLSDNQRVGAELLLDQTMGVCLYYPLCFLAYEVCSAITAQRVPDWTVVASKQGFANLLQAMRAQYFVWPFTELIGLKYIPQSLRVLFTSMISLVWNIFFCAMVAKR